jgi:hypothetical protein
MEMPIRRIAEWIDDWFAGYIRRYTYNDVQNRLKELGFTDTNRLKYGTVYDTSQRRQDADLTEIELMGEGDLRFFCQKIRQPSGNSFKLPDSPHGQGSPYSYSPILTQFSEPLELLSKNLKVLETKRNHEISSFKIMVCRSVHSKVRSLLESKKRFDIEELLRHLNSLNSLLIDYVKL